MDSPVNRELQNQRENTERCLAILGQCQTKDKIIEGFGQVTTLLRQANDPLADSAEMCFIKGGELPIDYVIRLKDGFAEQLRVFLSATEDGLEGL